MHRDSFDKRRLSEIAVFSECRNAWLFTDYVLLWLNGFIVHQNQFTGRLWAVRVTRDMEANL